MAAMCVSTSCLCMLEGIDIEPDRPGMQMTDVVLRDVTVRNNSGGGFMINVGNFNGSTPDISIEVTNMTVDGGSWTTGAVGIAVGNVVGVGGSISISGSRVLNTGGCGLAIYRKAARATAKLTLTDVNFTRVALGSQTKPGKSGCAPQGPCAPLMVMGGWDPPCKCDYQQLFSRSCRACLSEPDSRSLLIIARRHGRRWWLLCGWWHDRGHV